MRRLFVAAAALVTALSSTSAGAKELGFNVHQSPDVGLDATKDANLKWVRIDLDWLDAEPTTQGSYDWTRFDTQIDAATSKGLKVLAVVGYTPAWASEGDTKGGGSNNDVPKAGTFAPFVTAVVNRYKAKVSHFEIWNEPNLQEFFEGTTQEYLDRILVPGADAVHAACATCLVVGPGLATVGDQYAIWLDAIFTQAKAKIDIVSGHIYHDFPTPGGGAGLTSDSFFNKLEKHRLIQAGSVTVYEGPLSFKEMMDKHGVTKPFWLTETGETAHLGNAGEEDAQVTYYRRVLEEMLQRPWWDATIFYEAFDEPATPYIWGAVVHDENATKKYTPKKVHAFLAKVASSQPVFGGQKTDCDDGLDNDLDGLVDYPSDTQCASATAPLEGLASLDGGLPPDAGSASSSGSTGASSSSSSSSGGGSPSSSSSSSSSGSAPDGASDDGCAVASSSSLSDGAAFGALVAMTVALRTRARRADRRAPRRDRRPRP